MIHNVDQRYLINYTYTCAQPFCMKYLRNSGFTWSTNIRVIFPPKVKNVFLIVLCFSMKWRYIDIEPVLNFIPIKLHRVFLSYNVVTVSSHYLIFYQHMYARQLSNRSIFHAGRYLDDKEICYLGTVIVTANVCRALEWLNTGHISVLKYRHL